MRLILLAPAIALVALAACDAPTPSGSGAQTPSTASGTGADALAQQVAQKTGVSAADLAKARAEGVALKPVAGTPEGNQLEDACDALLRAAAMPGALEGLDGGAALTLAKCAGFDS